jgi:haloacetate dehalogenase
MPQGMTFFDGFALEHIDTGEAAIRVRHGGSGPPVVLLHGHPRTHTTWHRVAPLLAASHTVVCPDLRGYGRSSGPPTTPDHEPYSDRAMARDVVAVMAALGHGHFAVAGHDRGSGVAMRLAFDAADAVTHVAVLDGIPHVEALGRCDARFASAWWHWFFFAQTEKPAEEWICRDPDAWYRGDPEAMGAENHADWLAAVHDPATVHAMLEDYRAGVGIDCEHERADRDAGRRIACPLLTAWSLHDDLEELFGDPVAIWRSWADDVRGARIDSGHHMAEQAPEQLAAVLGEFVGAG